MKLGAREFQIARATSKWTFILGLGESADAPNAPVDAEWTRPCRKPATGSTHLRIGQRLRQVGPRHKAGPRPRLGAVPQGWHLWVPTGARRLKNRSPRFWVVSGLVALLVVTIVIGAAGASGLLGSYDSSSPSYKAGHEYGINLGPSMRKVAGQTSMSDSQRDLLCRKGPTSRRSTATRPMAPGSMVRISTMMTTQLVARRPFPMDCLARTRQAAVEIRREPDSGLFRQPAESAGTIAQAVGRLRYGSSNTVLPIAHRWSPERVEAVWRRTTTAGLVSA